MFIYSAPISVKVELAFVTFHILVVAFLKATKTSSYRCYRYSNPGDLPNCVICSVAVSPDLLLLNGIIRVKAALARFAHSSTLTESCAVNADDKDSIFESR